MKGFVGFAAALSLAINGASAHYIFQQLSIGGTQYPVYQYIRKNTNLNHPVTDLSSNDLRCNEGGGSGASTDTVTVSAGSQFTFTLDTPVYHQGPVSLYMSKAPGSVKDYDGSGPWFKIHDWGPTFSGGSASWNLAGSYTFNIPSCIQSGEYLLRIQSLGIHNPYPAGTPQFYIGCAQVKVTGGGSANPGPTALIPGAFKETDPGYTANIYSNFNSYVVPGPAVWTCGSSPQPQPTTTTARPTTLTTTTRPTTTTTTTTAPTTTAPPPGSCSAAKYAQCGGIGFSGCTVCASGSTCTRSNDYYSQCL